MVTKRENLAVRLRTSLVALSASLFLVLALPVLFQDSYHAVHAQDIEKEFAENCAVSDITWLWEISGDRMTWTQISGADTYSYKPS